MHCTSKGQDSKCDNWLNLRDAGYTSGIYTHKMKSWVRHRCPLPMQCHPHFRQSSITYVTVFPKVIWNHLNDLSLIYNIFTRGRHSTVALRENELHYRLDHR